jgi:hypothetical protein
MEKTYTMPTYSIDPLYPHWFRCDLCGQDVVPIYPAIVCLLAVLCPVTHRSVRFESIRPPPGPINSKRSCRYGP